MDPLPGLRATMRIASLVLAAMGSGGCQGHEVQLVLALHGLVPEASDVVDVYVVGACPAASALGGEPPGVLLHESFGYDTMPTPLGTVRVGHAGVYARVRGTTGTCAVRAAGCTDIAMLDATTVVDVSLIACAGSACPGAPTDSTCAGTQDAGPQDAAASCPDGAHPQPEVCDDVDNDCDGLIDENLSMNCAIDSCDPGIETCVGGHWTACTRLAPRTCATTPVGSCTSLAVQTVAAMSGSQSFDGNTCGQLDHFPIGNDSPCTPDAVFQLTRTGGTGLAYQITSSLPVATFASCAQNIAIVCGSTLSVNPDFDNTPVVVVEAPDGGCGPFHITFTTH